MWFVEGQYWPPNIGDAHMRYAKGKVRDSRSIAGVAAGLVVAAALLSGCTSNVQSIGSIGEATISAQEFSVHVDMVKRTVENQVRKDLKLAPSESLDWEVAVGDSTALEVLAQSAVDSATAAKSLQLAAKEAGVLGSSDYEDWQEFRSQENASNRDAVAAGGVVYGLVESSEMEFYSGQLSAIRKDLEKALSAKETDPLFVSIKEAKERFGENPEKWSANVAVVNVEMMTIPTEPDKQQEVFDEAAAAVRDGVSWEDLGITLKGTIASRQVTNIGEVQGADGEPLGLIPQQLASQLYGGVEKEIFGPTSFQGEVTLLLLQGKQQDDADAFEAYSNRIRAELAEEKLTQYLGEYQKNLDSQIDMNAAYVLTRNYVSK